MAPLTLSDFELRQATCELRYADSPLVFDRTGEIFHYLGSKFTNLHSDAATPTQTQMTADEGSINVQMNSARLTKNYLDSGLEKFAANCKVCFDFITERLDIAVFTRVGLRLIYVKPHASSEEPKTALNALRILGVKTETRFGVGSDIAEWLTRWESKEIGATLRFKAESGQLDAQLNPDLGIKERSIHKQFHHLSIDVDYYTVAIVERGQWDAVTWITQSGRIMRKEIDSILST
jgi:hypothetical protein